MLNTRILVNLSSSFVRWLIAYMLLIFGNVVFIIQVLLYSLCHSALDAESRKKWIPAFAGMTKYDITFWKRNQLKINFI